MGELFNSAIYEPILNGLLYVQKILPNHDMGLAIILVTLLIKGILYIPSLAAIRSSQQLQSLQPKLRALQQQYKNDREGLAKEQMKLYKDSKVNPLSSCLPILIQLPILIGIYQVFFNGLKLDDQGLLVKEQLEHVYHWLRDYYSTTPINTLFLNFLDITKSHNIPLALLAGATQFWQSKMLAAPKEPKTPEARDEALTSTMNRQMTYIFPVVTLLFTYNLPAALGLYWVASTVFTIVQQYIFLRSHKIANGPTSQSITPAS
jgi:YidC/Oxa1 family membrane protein insertase